MSILSSLLGLGKGQPVQQIPQTVQTQEIAQEVAPFIKDILSKGQALYEQRMEEGFVPFEGQTLADVTADQLAAQQGLRSLVGTQAGGLQEARELVRAQQLGQLKDPWVGKNNCVEVENYDIEVRIPLRKPEGMS